MAPRMKLVLPDIKGYIKVQIARDEILIHIKQTQRHLPSEVEWEQMTSEEVDSLHRTILDEFNLSREASDVDSEKYVVDYFKKYPNPVQIEASYLASLRTIVEQGTHLNISDIGIVLGL